MEFGQRLMTIRKNKKLSQGELAAKVGIHANVLGRYERGEARPFVEMVGKLATALEVSVDYLVGNSDMELDQATLDRMLEIQKLNEQDREHLLVMVDAYLRDARARKAYAH